MTQIDNETLSYVENFAEELKSGIKRMMQNDIGERLGEILLWYIDEKLKIYQEYFNIYDKEMAKCYQKGVIS